MSDGRRIFRSARKDDASVVIAVVVALGCAPGTFLAEPAAPALPGMTDPAMEHPSSTPPFHRERTFLVLVGAGLAGSGTFAYRLRHARRRRPRGAAGFVSEAVLKPADRR